MTTRHPHVGHPNPWYTAIEGRALLEALTLPWATPLLCAAPRGDGHPVLLLPGFLGDEASLVALRLFLKSRGYRVETWGFGRNVGFHRRHAAALEQKIRYLHHVTGRKVSLVGWSLGGVFAFYGAHEAPECVRSVVTMGSPLSTDAAGSKVAPSVQALYRIFAHPMGPVAHTMQPRARKLRARARLPMPVSCLYSVTDGVVPPQEATIDGDPALHENVEVPGSHLGLGFNALAMWIVAERLAQPENDWRPFRASGLAGWLYRWTTTAAPSA